MYSTDAIKRLAEHGRRLNDKIERLRVLNADIANEAAQRRLDTQARLEAIRAHLKTDPETEN